MPIPNSIDELTPGWLGQVLGCDVSAVEVLDAHSGTTGRARIALSADGSVPERLFLKLQPFDAAQREYVRMVGMGVAEARLYAEIGAELPVRVPRVWHSSFDDGDGSFAMVLEDLESSGCRFPSADDEDVAAIAASLMDELALLHSTYRGQDLPWLRHRALGAGTDPHQQARLRRLADIVVSALEQFAGDLPAEFRRLGELFVARPDQVGALWNEGPTTLVHGDDHVRNLFVDGSRTGLFDWAVACRAPGMRDVAYFLCNSLPTEVRRAEEHGLLARYRDAMAKQGQALDDRQVEDEYRVFAAYSWLSATTTAAMGSAWHPAEIGRVAMVRTTQAVVDLGVLDLLESRLGPA